MATAVQTKTRELSNRHRPAFVSRPDLSGDPKRAGSSIKSSGSPAVNTPSPAVVSLPVTHLAAGMRLPISKALKSRFGIGEVPVDSDFLHSVETIAELLEIGVHQKWISFAGIEQMIQGHVCGSSEQSRNCFSLINQCLNAITDIKNIFSTPILSALKEFDFQSGNSGGWEITFEVGTGEHGDPFSISTTPKLVASEYGLCVLVHDISKFPESLKIDIAQFIYFCSHLSHHSTSIDMVLDAGIRWMLLGDVAELDKEAEDELISLVHDDSAFSSCLQKHLGEDFMDDLFCSPEDISEFYLSHKEATALHKKLKPLTKNNVRNYCNRISKRDATPAWLNTAAKLLYEHSQWNIDMKECTEMGGHVPFSFSRPFGFNFLAEHRIFEFLHDTAMNGEESSSLSVELGVNTASILANLELGEILLLFVDEMLHQDN